MATLTEIALFKACVESPQYIKSYGDVNLERITGPTNPLEFTED